MRFGQTICAAFVISIIALICHVVLAEENALVAPLRRAESPGFVVLSLIQSWALALLFAYGYGSNSQFGDQKGCGVCLARMSAAGADFCSCKICIHTILGA
ncbi:hypothetical protein [Methylotuvimicrobium buryatense]|uniref:hypothetical protein n=1 Tax=Methylotuvimicrobium buryatense TaxID=95641 RepID=UPI00034B243C|nr:hypothetical protein [Methylotuvimicrobium buryatense]